MKSKLFLILLFQGSVLCGEAQQITRLDGSKMATTDIDKLVLRLIDTAHVTGMAISILNNYKIVYTKAYGLKNNQLKEHLDTSTIFCAASLSKAVFAFLCMKLVQEKTIDLDKPLYLYLNKPLPAYEKYKDLVADDRWKLITMRMCLSHTTGFPNWRFLNPTNGVLDKTGKLAIYFSPGEKYAYSGEGMALAQMVIEEVTGKNLEELASEKLFIPMGLMRTSYTWQPRFENDFAYGHTESGEMLGKKKRTRPQGTGSLETTIADYSRFIEYVMQKKGLNTDSWNMMFSPQMLIHSKYEFPTLSDETTTENDAIHLAYGLGWGLLNCKYGRAFFKEGHDDDGWQHYTISFIDKGTSIIIMSNSLNGEKVFRELLEGTIGESFTPWKWERYLPYNYVAIEGKAQ